jgi:hypothetical protein
VGVSVCLWVLVVGSVVPGPLKDIILQKEGRAWVKGQNAGCLSGKAHPPHPPHFYFPPIFTPQSLPAPQVQPLKGEGWFS